LKISYDISLIEQILDDLNRLTGVSFSFLDNEKRRVFSNGSNDDFCSFLQNNSTSSNSLCRKADKALLDACEKSLKLEHSMCHTGLYDAAMALVKNDVICGYIIFGRIRSESSPETPIFYGPDKEKAARLYKKIPYCTAKQLDALYDLVSHIFFEKAIVIKDMPLSLTAENYIEKNLSKDLSVSSLCKELGVNKNQLYALFEDFFGMSVGEYVTDKRIKEAKRLLSTEKIPISEVAERVGVFNYSYFFRLFKRKTGLTPKQYIKENNNA